MNDKELNLHTKAELISMINSISAIKGNDQRRRALEPCFNGKSMRINKMGLLEYSDWRINLYKEEFKVEPDNNRKIEYTRLIKEEINNFLNVYDELLKKVGINEVQKVYIDLNRDYLKEIQNL